jgi:hypothetical protein
MRIMADLNDEGYSEEVRLAEDSATTSQEITSYSAVPEWILALPESQRSGMLVPHTSPFRHEYTQQCVLKMLGSQLLYFV